ncbi:hypothetical protein DesfrDRAFT_0011 [Solidesulfovibrio fructosivorans JJ]]|uniref:Uncharacterized protein n=1 Tax=Solidesulfovibrio fructosivorans JJ] TaxID=596151 RepID=E1JQW2_SOLFR|nr:hypothetical protein DesfrDRAFT_0011 [Solidesulfovibrio fructosivorans JJ]]
MKSNENAASTLTENTVPPTVNPGRCLTESIG